MAEATISPEGRVVGRYVLHDALAAGGMATVHIGRILGEGGFSRSVAIKRLHAQFAKDPDFAAGFLEEARLVARIRHPNVVPVLDVVSMEGELLIVMDYVQGETLTRLTRVSRSRNRIVPMPIALAIAADMLAGLHAAHEAKDERGQPLRIVHRDISPHNVMVGHDGNARVLDFGIAKASSSAQATREGEVRGKFAYMSPEQLASIPVDRRADLFATAIVLWEMLTGRRLFQADDPAGIVGKVLHGKLEAPGSVVGGLPPALDALVMKGLERDRERRFATAVEMATELENLRLPIARPKEVGVWVDRIAGDTLKQRAKRIAEIESTGSFSRIQAVTATAAISGPLPPATISGPLPAAPESTSSQSGLRPKNASPVAAELMPSRTKPGSTVGLVILGVAVAGAGLAAALGFFVWRSQHREHAAATPPPTLAVSVAVPGSASAVAPSAATDAPGIPVDALTGAASGPPASHPRGTPALRTKGTAPVKNPSADLTAAPSPPPISQNAPPRPSLAQVQMALGSVMPAARACVKGDDSPSHAVVTFQSDGSVKSVSVSGFAAGTLQETCIKNALTRARSDPFTDPTFALPVTLTP